MYLPNGLIKKITVWHGRVVDRIKFQTDCNTCNVGDSKSSLLGGYLKDTICIDYPDEYLVSLSWTSGRYDDYKIVKSLCFKTNVNSYGPYGTGTDTSTTTDANKAFSYEDNGVIVGFYGRLSNHRLQTKYYSKHLSLIGFYVMSESLALGQSSTFERKIMQKTCSSIPEMVMTRDPGPWGAGGGKPWDDGVFFSIKQVRVHLGDLNVIYVLQFEYQGRDSSSFLTQTYGRIDGSKIEVVNLDVKDDEYLIGISGCYGPVDGYNGLEAIVSITFHSNKRIHGPYGEVKSVGCVYYSSPASPGKVVGFHGRDNGFLSAIGVHMKYFRR